MTISRQNSCVANSVLLAWICSNPSLGKLTIFHQVKFPFCFDMMCCFLHLSLCAVTACCEALLSTLRCCPHIIIAGEILLSVKQYHGASVQGATLTSFRLNISPAAFRYTKDLTGVM